MVKLDEKIKEIVILNKPSYESTNKRDIFIIIYTKGLIKGLKKNKVLIGKMDSNVPKTKNKILKGFRPVMYYTIKDIRNGNSDKIELPTDYETKYKVNSTNFYLLKIYSLLVDREI